ncbi:hypothetical protein AB0G64_31370 [Streptomyces longwoodensis]|uniref:hypothetical protein n=1 Tax=Streptomyces longwoodensis TaxID=68231 RepID=UPI0033D17043
MAEALSRRLDRPVSVRETGLTDDSGESAAVGGQGSVLQKLVVLAGTDADPARRVTLIGSVFRQRTVPGPESLDAYRSVGPVRRTAAVTGADVERIRFLVSQFAAGWYRYGGGHARTALASCLGDDVGRLVVHPASSAERRELGSTAAQLAHLLGEMTADAGQQGLAQRYYLLALETAAEADDHHTRAIILRSMSVQAIRMAALQYAADLADAAVTTASPSSSGDLQAFVLTQRAHVRALRGERHGAHQDLDAAEGALDRADDRQGPFFRYPRAGFAYRQGQTLHRLGDDGPALDALRYAATHRPAHEHRLTASSQARAALVLLERGQIEEACFHGWLLTKEYPFLRSHRSALALRELRARLVPFRRLPEAAALLAKLSSFATPAARSRPSPGA